MREDENAPRPRVRHEIGQELALLSVAELHDRVALLREEIARLEADIQKKRASKEAASAFFKL